MLLPQLKGGFVILYLSIGVVMFNAVGIPLVLLGVNGTPRAVTFVIIFCVRLK